MALTATTPCPILTLPIELHLEISSFLSSSALWFLTSTNAYFRSLKVQRQISARRPKSLDGRITFASILSRSLYLSPNHLVCLSCARSSHWKEFCNHKYGPGTTERNVKKGWARSLENTRASKAFDARSAPVCWRCFMKAIQKVGEEAVGTGINGQDPQPHLIWEGTLGYL
jgi:hypothetical protein